MMNGLVDMHIAAGNRLRAENEELRLRIKQLDLMVSELQEALKAMTAAVLAHVDGTKK
jgi:hypothetical protein